MPAPICRRSVTMRVLGSMSPQRRGLTVLLQGPWTVHIEHSRFDNPHASQAHIFTAHGRTAARDDTPRLCCKECPDRQAPAGIECEADYALDTGRRSSGRLRRTSTLQCKLPNKRLACLVHQSNLCFAFHGDARRVCSVLSATQATPRTQCMIPTT